MFGPLSNPKNQNLKDLNPRELMVLLPLVVWAFWIGLYPKPYFDVLEKPVAKIVERVHPGYYAQAGKVVVTQVNPSAAKPGAER